MDRMRNPLLPWRHILSPTSAGAIALMFLSFGIPGTAVAQESNAAQPRLALVDPFIGTGPDGHIFPGATVPFGMVQLSPDTQIRQSNRATSGLRKIATRTRRF
jgi:putative alpha-1,2-mannosidase